MEFKFPQRINSYLAAAFELAKVDGNHFLSEIIKAARPEFTLDVWRDEFDGCVYYHNLVLHIPVKLFEKVGRRKTDLEQGLQKLLESVSIDISTERIHLVSLLPDIKDTNWRAVINIDMPINSDAIARIWGKDGYKVFISHLSTDKALASNLKKQLSIFGCASFVAHEDIEPTKEWQNEIECALGSMDCLVALMTPGFHESKWTDQEIGYALGRGVTVMPVRLGIDPYGFVGKIQAVKCQNNDILNLGWQVYKRLPCFTNEEDAFIKAVEAAEDFDDTVVLATILSRLAPLSEAGVKKITEIAMKNRYIRESNTFWVKTRHSYGLHYYISKWLGYDLKYDHLTNSYVRVG